MRFVTPWAWGLLPLLASLVWVLRRQWAYRLGLDRAAFVARLLALVLLALALTGPQTVSRDAQRLIYFVADRSASSPLARDDALLVQTLVQFGQESANTRYGLIVFGKDAFIDQPFGPSIPEAVQTAVDPSGSDLAGALRLALETLPRPSDGTAGNADVIVLSDGQVNESTLEGVLERARRMGVRIWALPLGARAVSDVRLDGLQLPREVAPDRPFEGVAYIHATQRGGGTLLVYRDDALIQAIEVDLEPGTNAVNLSDRLPEAGHYRYQVRFRGDEDQFPENNVAVDLVTVSGEAALLVFDSSGGAGGEGLSRVLDIAGFTHERRPFQGQRLQLADLAAFKAVVVNNVDIDALDLASINALKAYVGELGGGLWVIEGQNALSGVTTSPIEDLLPVTYEGPQREQLPGVALVFVLDRSSSMGQSAMAGAGLTKLDVLKEAAAKSIEVLREEDWIGIMTFDSAFQWLVPLQPLRSQDNRQNIYTQLQQVFAGGGTDMLPPLAEAFSALAGQPARIKHILVFSDGKTVRQDRDFETLFEQLAASDVTVSSIGLGQQPDEEMLQRLADAGQGKLFLVRDVAELPKISVRETRRIVQRRWVVGELAVAPGPFAQLRLSGLEVSSLPAVGGYVRTFGKPLSQQALTVEGNPLLSFWQYGLGQVGVLNTDLDGIWTSGWAQWPQFSELVGEVVSQLYADPVANTGLVLNSSMQEDTLRLELDALDGDRWVNLLNISGNLVGEGGTAQQADPKGLPVRFEQVGPGRYVAEVPKVGQGLNLLMLEAKNNAQITTQQTHVVAVPYPSEYQNLGVNEGVLDTITSRTGGRVLEDEQLELGPMGEGGLMRFQDLWPLLVGLSLALFLADLLLRKVPLEAWLAARRAP